MRIRIVAVGRLRSGPERALIEDYQTRFDRTGRSLGLGPLSITEIDDRKGGGMPAEAALIQRSLTDSSAVCALDERGKTPDSREFSNWLAKWRDDGTHELSFIIGGADGLDPSIRTNADRVLSLGAMVWPHMLARVMLTEQLYRAATILAGGPYHRD